MSAYSDLGRSAILEALSGVSNVYLIDRLVKVEKGSDFRVTCFKGPDKEFSLLATRADTNALIYEMHCRNGSTTGTDFNGIPITPRNLLTDAKRYQESRHYILGVLTYLMEQI